MRTSRFRFLLLTLPLALAACSSDADESNDDGNTQYEEAPRGTARPDGVPASAVDCATGPSTLKGRFLAPNGTTPVAGAFVYAASGDCWAGTDKDGYFVIKGLPNAETQVRAEKGIFRTEVQATPGKSALSLQVNAAAVPLAYVAGAFDTMQHVLERLGFTPEQIDEDSLTSDVLSKYAGVFLNCGLNEYPMEYENALQALNGYVESGGVLYASDWAESYVTAAFPGRVTFLAPDPRVGATGEQEAAVLDEGLKRALGKGTATINFDSPVWAVIDSVAAGTEVLVRGPVVTMDGTTLSDRPYLVQFATGKGRVTYTSFHNEAQTTGDVDVLLEQLLFQL